MLRLDHTCPATRPTPHTAAAAATPGDHHARPPLLLLETTTNCTYNTAALLVLQHGHPNSTYTATKAVPTCRQLHQLRIFHAPGFQLQLLRRPPLSGHDTAAACSSCDVHHCTLQLHDSKVVNGFTEVHQLQSAPSPSSRTPNSGTLQNDHCFSTRMTPLTPDCLSPPLSATRVQVHHGCYHLHADSMITLQELHSWIFLVAIIKTSCSG